MTMFSPGDRSEKIGMTLDSLVASESWGEIWRATHDKLSKVLVVAYKREEGKNLFLAAQEGFETWKRLAESGTRGLLRIHKIVSSGKIPMLIVEDPGGETAREFFSSEAATLKKTARMVRACCRTLQALEQERLLPVGITPDTIIRKEGEEDYPSFLIPVSPGIFGDAVRVGDGRYLSHDALLLGDQQNVNADVYSLAWIWAELLARNHKIDHQASRLRHHVHYPKLREIIRKTLVFRDDRYMDPKKLEFEADQWLENDAASDREAYDHWAEKQKRAKRKRRRARRRKERSAGREEAASAAPGGAESEGTYGEASPGTGEEFGEGESAGEESEEDELAFAEDIPPLAEPAARREAAAAEADEEARPAAAAATAPKEGGDATSSFFPILITGCFVFIILGAFSAGVWLLMGLGESDAPPAQVADADGAASGEEAGDETGEAMGAPETSTTAAEATPETPLGTPEGPSPEPEEGEASPTPRPTPEARPDSVQALVNAFRAANQERDVEAIRNLYFEEREFEAVRGVLGTLGVEDGEVATLNFVPRSGPTVSADGIQGVGTLRVTTSAFNLEIPVGRQDGRFFLTSVGRVGELWPAPPTPEPIEEPLEYKTWAKGEWPAESTGNRIFRIGLGEEAEAAVVLERNPGGDEPLKLTSTLSNPASAKLYYQYAFEVTDDDGRLLTIGSGGGEVEAGTSEVRRTDKISAPKGALATAAGYNARWYEGDVPLGLVGGQVIKNPRIPVGFARAYTFEMGDAGEVSGRIYTEYINNQKAIAAPVILQNETERTMDAVCAVGFYDAKGQFVTGRSERTRAAPGEVKPFENLLCMLPQGAYGEVVSYEAVLYVDGVEYARASAELPPGEARGGEVASLETPTPSATPTPTPTPLPASVADASTDRRSPTENMTVEETLAMMEPAQQQEQAGAAEGDWTDEFEEGAAEEAGAAPTPLPDEQVERIGRIASGLGTAWSILSVVFGYFIAAFCFQKIMEKTDKKDLALVAWIPVVNWVAVPWLISGRSIMFPILAFIIPCLGLFFYIAMWYDVCVARNKSGIWAFVVTFIPILGVPYLAFSE